MKKSVWLAVILSVILSGMVYADLSDGLVAYYPLNGNANDESGNGYHGILMPDVGSGPTVTQGLNNEAYKFDGMDDYIELFDFNPGIAFSMALWVNPQTTTGRQAFVSQSWTGDGAASNFYLGFWDGELTVHIDDGQYVDGNVFTGWHHIVVVVEQAVSESIVKLYKDGSLEWEHTTNDILGNPTATWCLGQEWSSHVPDTTGDFFDGAMDEVRFYDRILLLEEIEQLATDFSISASLNPPSGPEDVASRMVTIEAIADYLETGFKDDKPLTPFQEPLSGPTDTGRTLDEIMEAAPKTDNVHGALPSQVISNKTYWSLRTDGTWGLQTGTIPIQALSSESTNVAAGYYNATTLVAVDSDLDGSNILYGVNIFGIGGAIPTITLSPNSDNVYPGYYEATTLSGVDSDLVAENIGCGITIFGVTGTIGLPECIKKTGQVGCWDEDGVPITPCDGSGQDGDYQLGCEPVSVPYEGDSGYSRTWFECSAGFTTNGDGTVTDQLTGLIWLNVLESFGELSWQQALTACNGLAADNQVGLGDGSEVGDWRLPNLNEILSLIDRMQSNPALPHRHPFLGVYTGQYWTSTTYEGSASQAWDMDFSNGYVGYGSKTSTYYVWPVRGGQ